MLDVKKWMAKVTEWIKLNRIQTTTISGTTNNMGALRLSNVSGDSTVLAITVTSGGTNYFGIPFKYDNRDWYAKVVDWQNLSSLNSRAVSLKVWYVVGGVARRLLNALKMLTSERGWATC